MEEQTFEEQASVMKTLALGVMQGHRIIEKLDGTEDSTKNVIYTKIISFFNLKENDLILLMFFISSGTVFQIAGPLCFIIFSE